MKVDSALIFDHWTREPGNWPLSSNVRWKLVEILYFNVYLLGLKILEMFASNIWRRGIDLYVGVKRFISSNRK